MSSSLRFGVAGLCLITALGIAMILFTFLKPAQVITPVAQVAPAPLQHTYLVAARRLPAGTLLREEDFTPKPMEPSKVSEAAVTDSPEIRASLRGALLRTYVDAGGTITADDVLRPRDRGFIASVLKAGDNAVTIGVDPVTGVGGLVWPGDHVNVILTQSLEHAAPASKTWSETVLTDVRVIAVDQEMVEGASGDTTTAGKLARTVTVEVTPVQAQKLNVAAQLGKLSLSIRSATDKQEAEVQPTYSTDVSTVLARPAGATVKIYDGDKVREVTFP